MIEKEYDITTEVLNFQSNDYERHYHKPNLVEIEEALYLSKASEHLPETSIKEIVVEHYDALSIKRYALNQAQKRYKNFTVFFGATAFIVSVVTGVLFGHALFVAANTKQSATLYLILGLASLCLQFFVNPLFNPFVLRARSKFIQSDEELRHANTPNLRAKLEANVRQLTRKKKEQANQPLEEKIAHQL